MNMGFLETIEIPKWLQEYNDLSLNLTPSYQKIHLGNY